MILATADNTAMVLGDSKAGLRTKPVAVTSPPASSDPSQSFVPGKALGIALQQDDQQPLTEEEIEEYSRIKCCVCGENVAPEEVAEHSRRCVLAPAPNLRLQLDKWCIASANMTATEQRMFINMRRTEELAQVEGLEADLAKRVTQLWWMSGRFGYIISSRWLREWRSFVGVGRVKAETREVRPPAPISNGDLFELDGSFRPGLREGVQHDYHVLEQPMWDFFTQVYGGGPSILRYNASGVLPALSDPVASFDGDWRDLRPDTGHGKVFDAYSGFGFDGEVRGGFLWSCTGNGLLHYGSHFEGQVADGLPVGEGREVRPDGTILEGNFRNRKLHGTGRVTDPSGQQAEGVWEDGVLMGI